MTLIPYAEYRPDVSDYLSQYTQTAQNVVPRGDGYGPFLNLVTISASLGSACRGFFKAVRTDGSILIFAATATRLFSLNNTTFAWTDVSKGATTYSAVSSTDNWQFAQFGNFIFATQSNTVLQVFDLTVSVAFADSLGSPPQARYIGVVGRFIVLTGLLSLPYRIAWSGLNDVNSVNSWTVGLNSCDVQDLPDGGIVRGVAGGEFGTILQDAVIRRMTYLPGSAVVFQIERLAEDVGLYAPYSLVRTNSRIFFLAPSGLMGMDSTGIPQPIGKERVDRTLLADIDKANLQLFIGASDPRSCRVFWAYKSTNGSAGLFDKMLCYDWTLDRFTPIEMSGEYLGSLSQPGITLEGLDSISSSIDALGLSLDSFTTSVTPEVACFDPTHSLGFFRGAPLEAIIETGEQTLQPRRMLVRGFTPITDATAVLGSASMRENVQTAPTYSPESALLPDGFIETPVDCRYSRGRIRIPAASIWSYARGIDPEVVPMGFE